eukprot:1149234-Pelagomonas_calceolata.AAC.14
MEASLKPGSLQVSSRDSSNMVQLCAQLPFKCCDSLLLLALTFLRAHWLISSIGFLYLCCKQLPKEKRSKLWVAYLEHWLLFALISKIRHGLQLITLLILFDFFLVFLVWSGGKKRRKHTQAVMTTFCCDESTLQVSSGYESVGQLIFLPVIVVSNVPHQKKKGN